MIRSAGKLLLVMAITLALAACGKGDSEDALKGGPVAAVAAPAGQQWVDVVALTPEGGWLLGNPNAPIKLVEYGSLTCPACASFSVNGMQPLRDNYVNSGRVSYEFRSVPIHGAVDLVLTRLLQCAPKESAHPLAEQLWSNHTALLDRLQANGAGIEQAMTLPDNQRFVAYAREGGLLDFFAARGVSVDQSQQCLSDFGAIEALAASLDSQSQKDGVTGTPTFFVNGTQVDTTTWASNVSGPGLEAALQNAGAR